MNVVFQAEVTEVEKIKPLVGCSMGVRLIFTESIELDESTFTQTNTIILDNRLARILQSQLEKALKESI